MRRLVRVVSVLSVGFLLIWLLWPAAGPRIEPGSTLVLEIAGEYVEAAEAPLLSRMLGDERRPFPALLSEMRKAERDERLKTVVLRIGPLQVGWGKAQEIREAIRSLSEAGRRTIAYVELAGFGANLEYYVSTAADEIHFAPGTRAPVVGLAAEFLFLGGLWEKLGVELEVERIGRYKTAADFIAGREMSDAHREMAGSLLDSIDAQFIEGIARGRDLDETFVRQAIDQAPFEPSVMLGLGLIDAVSFYDELIDAQGGSVVKSAEYAQIDPASVGFKPGARFALVYGSGSVVDGRGSTNRSGDPVLASLTVSQAIEDAAEDDGVQAIIFRIDSPGGSALASDLVWRAVARARASGKPVIASFSDVAASGGYYVACGADEIVAPAGAITGSIGVVVLRPVLGGLFDKLDIGFETMTRGARADLLLSSRRLSSESRAVLRSETESVYALFVSRVAAGRSLDVERVDGIGRGRVWTGAQAAEIGLIDAVGGLRVAVRRGAAALGLDPETDVVLVPYPPPKSLAEELNEALRRVAIRAAPELPLSGVADRLRRWLASVPFDAPALLPPFVVEIR
jgi:protease-4